jgi:hypothetical protein
MNDDFFDQIIDPYIGRAMYFDRQGNPISLRQWGELREHGSEEGYTGDSYVRVAQDQVGTAWVSTVWLGINHNWSDGPPIIFETMIFGDYFIDGELVDTDCARYSTEEEAIEGHKRTVSDLQAGRLPWFEESNNGGRD